MHVITLLPLLAQFDLLFDTHLYCFKVLLELLFFLSCMFDFKVNLIPKECFFLVFDPI